jgi:23S rRNA (guanosine2251-2'-O)-methyltransferase
VPGDEAQDLVHEGEELVAGRHPVEEALAARRQAHRLLVVPHRREALERIVLHATTLRIPIIEVEGGTLTAIAGFDGHQGVAVVVAARRFATLEDVLARAIERGEPPFVLALDSLEDPQNLGSLLRSAEAAGVHGVLFPTRRQAPLSPSAVKASAGAVEHLLLVPVDDLAGALADLHVRGLRVAGAEADAALTHREADLRGPVVLVVGHEGQGLGPAVRRRCDLLVRIPMHGRIASLNAAVAGSILLFEAAGQRGEAPPPPVFADEPDEVDETAEPAIETSAEPSEVVVEVVVAPKKGRRKAAPAEAPIAEPGPEPAAVAAEPAPAPKKGRRKAAPAEAPIAEPGPAPAAVAAEPAPAPKKGRRKAAPAEAPIAEPGPEPAAVAAEPAPAPKKGRRKAAPAEAPIAEPGPEPAAVAAEPAPAPKKGRRKAAPVGAAATPADPDDDLLPGGPPVPAPGAKPKSRAKRP